MDSNLIERLNYSRLPDGQMYHMHRTLQDASSIVTKFFENNTNNKLCLVFPSRDYAAQWLSVPMVLSLVKDDYEQYKSEIIESYKAFVVGDRLILNNKAIVEWVGIKQIIHHGFCGPTFRTKGVGLSSGAEVTIGYDDGIRLQKADPSRNLSSIKRVKDALPERNITPLERLLGIDTFGNRRFIKNTLCLISRFRAYEDSLADVLIDRARINDYFKPVKIDENGQIGESSPLVISNSLSNLALYLGEAKPVLRIIIDGFSSLTPRNDYLDIDRKFRIPTVLVSDLSEIDVFEEIRRYGFDFFDFTKEYITIQHSGEDSPFERFDRKLSKYVSFNLERIICNNEDLAAACRLIHSLPREDSDQYVNALKISLIQQLNLLSRMCHSPTQAELSRLMEKIGVLESYFERHKLWLGDAREPIKGSIMLLKKFVEQLPRSETGKCQKLNELLQEDYDYIICCTEEEADTLRRHIAHHRAKVIPITDLDDGLSLGRDAKAILSGWPKSGNFNRILSAFLLSQLTVLFYPFENEYYGSLQRRNKKNSESILPTITEHGIRPREGKPLPNGFEHLYSANGIEGLISDRALDIMDFELKIDNAQYSKYRGSGNIAECCKARRVGFHNSAFVYATDSHKFIVIDELFQKGISNPKIYNRTFELLSVGDIIAFINTDTDVLVAMVELTAQPEELEKVKKWTNLWKDLLRLHYISIGQDFRRLVADLRKHGCMKHHATIRAWLQDDNRIGPDDDADLKSIALMGKSDELSRNIATVRKAISQMTSWRMQASDKVREMIKRRLAGIAKSSSVSAHLDIEGLGSVNILKITELHNKPEEIDKRYLHRLLGKESI